MLSETKERKFDEFIDLLSKKSNEYLSKINVDAFTGVIDFQIIKRGSNIKVKIQLLDENGNPFYPNKSLETSMYISILLAISDLTKKFYYFTTYFILAQFCDQLNIILLFDLF